jgi:protein ImuB
MVVYGKRGNAELIVAVDEAAERRGLATGLALAQARAMHPHLQAIEEDAEADASLLESIADWCLRYTPLVACNPPDGLLLDITGCAHLYGGEAMLVTDLGERIARAGFAYTIAIAGSIGAAWAASHYGEPASYAGGEERVLLAPLPLSALRLEPGTVAALARVGLKRIGDIVDLPRAPLTARFGSEVLRQLDRALGNEHEPLNPRLPVAPYVAEQRFAEPIAREEHVLAIVARLAARLQFTLKRRGDGARRLELTLFRTDGEVRRLAAGTSRPLRDPAQIRALFVERLAALADAFDPGFGFDMARLSVMVAEPCPPEQIGIGGGEEGAQVDRLVDRLSARLGARRVRRLIAQDSHIPEIAAASMPAPAAVTAADPGWQAFRRFRAEAELAPRPLRLLTRPEPIEALAEVPDGPPLRFRWRRALHEVIAAEGPERIEGAWWSEHGGPARDYFRVEDKAGLRFWLFRSGLYRDLAHGAAAPAWFLHGTFA